MIKKYWDVVGGVITGITLAILANIQVYIIQLCYSIIILILVNIAVFRTIKQSVDKKRAKCRDHNIIDSMVDSLKPIKAISIAQNPTKDGEVLGKLILNILGGLKDTMKKIKDFFSKFKGYILAFSLIALSVLEMCGGFINELAGGVLVINGIEVVPFATLLLAVIVGILSNGYSKEQIEQIKALFKKSTTNELVTSEIKKTLKADEAKVKEFNKILATKNSELDNFNTELDAKKNTLSAKKEMQSMIPQLATAEDVRLAEYAVREVMDKIEVTKQEIAEVESSIDNLNKAISALKSRLTN
jgi:hypothetical protein